MRNLFILLSLFILFKSNAQNDTLPKTSDTNQSHTYTYAEKMPVFINGGEEGFRNFIKDNIVIPAGLKKSGTVFIEYVVETDGSVSNIKVVKGKGLSKSYNQACIDVVSKSPKWTPAEQNGELRRLKTYVRIKF
jgi:protein TonB